MKRASLDILSIGQSSQGAVRAGKETVGTMRGRELFWQPEAGTGALEELPDTL